MRRFARLSVVATMLAGVLGEEPAQKNTRPKLAAESQADGEKADAAQASGVSLVQASTVIYYLPAQGSKLETKVDENGVLYLLEKGNWRLASFEESRAIRAASPSLPSSPGKGGAAAENDPAQITASARSRLDSAKRAPASVETAKAAKNPVEAHEAAVPWHSRLFTKPSPPEPRFKGPGLIIKARLKRQSELNQSPGEPSLMEKLLTFNKRAEEVGPSK